MSYLLYKVIFLIYLQDDIGKDPFTQRATLVPIILGSDKMMVSVPMGQNGYWPIYLSIGNIHNNVLLGFLANSKSMFLAIILLPTCPYIIIKNAFATESFYGGP